MDIEEAIENYKELKRNKNIIANIDTDFFFEFAETILQKLENMEKNYISKDKIRNYICTRQKLIENQSIITMYDKGKEHILNELQELLESEE